MNSRLRLMIVAAAASLWLLSLLLPAVQPQQDSSYPGWMILMMGWTGVFVLQFGWLANLLLPPAWVLVLSKSPRPWLLVVLASVLSGLLINALFWRDMYYDSGSRPIELYQPAYYLWFGSGLITVAALFTRAHVLRRKSA